MASVTELHIRNVLARFRRFMAPYEADEPLAASFRAKQLQAVLGLTPLAMLVNLFNATVVMSRMPAHAQWLWVWFLVLLVFAAQGLRAWYRTRDRPPRPHASLKAMRRAVRHAAGLGALWGLLPALLLPGAAPQDQHMLTMISCGMICAGGFALVTVPAAAMSYVGILTLGSAIGLLRVALPGAHVLLCLLLVYSLVVVASVRVMARSYGSRLVAEADAAHKEQIVGLLLRDFEENSSDFLWELSYSGQLGHSSNRLAKALQFDPHQDSDKNLVALIARTQAAHPRGADDSAQYLEKLQKALATPLPFRDVVVPVMLNGKQRWWALTAKPVFLVGPAGQADYKQYGWRGVGADITDRKHAEDEMHRLAHFDALTGLANRRHFQHRLQQLCSQDGGNPGSAALLCIDMDNFKRVNDAHGHANGDLLLKTVAQRMVGAIRARDLVARLGGDEFAILLDGIAQPDEVRLFTERLMQNIEQPCNLSGIGCTPHTSIGIALLPQDGRHADEILHHADLALYEAKARGRRQAHFFSPALDEKSRRRIALEDDLRHALQQGNLNLVYQPQVSLTGQHMTGVEALLRWTSTRFGSVSPAEFIPIAEEAGLICDIGLWVLQTACQAARQLPDALLMAVNLSARQFDDALLVDKILAVLEKTGLDPQRLELEITESVFLADTDDVLAALHRLRSAGIRIALDDFGTGYSSLAYLRSFPFNKLKIDRSFVMHIGDSTESDAIVRSVIDLASGLHMVTTAEGIETAEQCQRLTQLACTTGQGYYFARPLGLDAVLERLAQPTQQISS
ncbi:MAG: EAL domain-containing protein [Burkholderiales bacterium]|nr:EAL domain-containing protein [Burkholderiales bacterium]